MINEHPDVLAEACGLPGTSWKSPLQADDYAEYSDQDFLDLLCVETSTVPLADFWPRRGPQWDALGVGPNGEAILVEAKANVPEILSPTTQASDQSRALIDESLAAAASAFGAGPGVKWSERFYQYANRLAHGYWLSELNDVETVLVFVNFVGDDEVNGPQSRAEWEAAFLVLHEALGLRGRLPKFVRDVFIDVRGDRPVAL